MAFKPPPPTPLSRTHRANPPTPLLRLQLQQYEDMDTFVVDFPDSSDYTIGIIVDPCKVSGSTCVYQSSTLQIGLVLRISPCRHVLCFLFDRAGRFHPTLRCGCKPSFANTISNRSTPAAAVHVGIYMPCQLDAVETTTINKARRS